MTKDGTTAGGGPLHRWWPRTGAATGLGPGNERQLLLADFLIYFCFQVFTLPTFFLCSSISIRWDTCLFLPRHILPFHTNLQQGFEMKRKKDIKCRKINLTRRNTQEKPRCAHYVLSWIIPTPCGEWKEQKITLILNKSSLICFPLEVALKLQLASESHMKGFYKNLLALPQVSDLVGFGVELKEFSVLTRRCWICRSGRHFEISV